MSKLLYVTEKPFYPDSSGGAQRSSMYIFNRLKSLGWDIEVACKLPLTFSAMKRGTWIGFSESSSLAFVKKDIALGYPCWRRISMDRIPGAKNIDTGQWMRWVDFRLDLFQPDIVISDTSATSPLLKRAIYRGFPSIHIARSVPILGMPSIIPPELHFIANSPYTASIIKAITGKRANVVFPNVAPEQYQVENRTNRFITLINPVPQKGVNVAIEIARAMPEERFLFVKGRWSGFSSNYIESFVKPVRKFSNTEIWENQEDMKSVYAVTKILLMPSQFIETFGRVILEANLNGIPVVASKVGGIPYTLGKGGLLIEPRNDPNAFVKALRKLCKNKSIYEKLSKLALKNSCRPEFAPELQIEKFVKTAYQILNKRKPPRGKKSERKSAACYIP